jgi:hypothetical protein
MSTDSQNIQRIITLLSQRRSDQTDQAYNIILENPELLILNISNTNMLLLHHIIRYQYDSLLRLITPSDTDNTSIVTQDHMSAGDSKGNHAWHYALQYGTNITVGRLEAVHNNSEPNTFNRLINTVNYNMQTPVEYAFDTVGNDISDPQFTYKMENFIDNHYTVLNTTQDIVMDFMDQVDEARSDDQEEDSDNGLNRLYASLDQWSFNIEPPSPVYSMGDVTDNDDPSFGRNLNEELAAVANPAELGVKYTLDEFLAHQLPTEQLVLFEQEEENCDFTGPDGRKDYPVRVEPTKRIYCARQLKLWVSNNPIDPFNRELLTGFVYLTQKMIEEVIRNKPADESVLVKTEESEVAKRQSDMLDIMKRQLVQAEEILLEATNKVTLAEEQYTPGADQSDLFWARQEKVAAQQRVETLRRMIQAEEARREREKPAAEGESPTERRKTLQLKITPYKLKF